MISHYSQYYTSYSPSNLGVWLVGLIFLIFYFLPSIIAKRRRHKDRLAIYVLNFFVSWSGLGWIVCLVWSLTSNVE